MYCARMEVQLNINNLNKESKDRDTLVSNLVRKSLTLCIQWNYRLFDGLSWITMYMYAHKFQYLSAPTTVLQLTSGQVR